MACCGKRNKMHKNNKYGCLADDVRARYTGPKKFVYTFNANVYRWLETGTVLCIAKVDLAEPFFEEVPLGSV